MVFNLFFSRAPIQHTTDLLRCSSYLSGLKTCQMNYNLRMNIEKDEYE